MLLQNSPFIYKVFFEGGLNNENQALNITFFGNQEIICELPDFAHFLLKFNELSRKRNAFSITNIHEIITLGNASKLQIKNFHVLLLTIVLANNQEKKTGLLIGNHKERGYVLLGTWPYHPMENSPISIEEIGSILDNILNNSIQSKNLLLIS